MIVNHIKNQTSSSTASWLVSGLRHHPVGEGRGNKAEGRREGGGKERNNGKGGRGEGGCGGEEKRNGGEKWKERREWEREGF